MVLHAFDVVINGVVVEAEEFEEIGEELMAMGDVSGEGLARGGEGKATIFFVFEESVCIEALDHVSHASLRNIESGGDVDDACVTLRVDEFENLFEIIFDRGRGGAVGGASDGAHGARVGFFGNERKAGSSGGGGGAGEAFSFAPSAEEEEGAEGKESGDDGDGNHESEGGGGEGGEEFGGGENGVEEAGGGQCGEAAGEGLACVEGSRGTASRDDGEGPSEPFVDSDDERGREQGSGKDGGWGTDEIECVVNGGEVVGEDFGEGCDAEHQESGPTGEPEEIIRKLDEFELCCGGSDKDGDKDAESGSSAEGDTGDDSNDGGRVFRWGKVGHSHFRVWTGVPVSLFKGKSFSTRLAAGESFYRGEGVGSPERNASTAAVAGSFGVPRRLLSFTWSVSFAAKRDTGTCPSLRTAASRVAWAALSGWLLT